MSTRTPRNTGGYPDRQSDRVSREESKALRLRWRALLPRCQRAGIRAPRRLLQTLTDLNPRVFGQLLDPLGADIIRVRAELLNAALTKMEAMCAQQSVSSAETTRISA